LWRFFDKTLTLLTGPKGLFSRSAWVPLYWIKGRKKSAIKTAQPLKRLSRSLNLRVTSETSSVLLERRLFFDASLLYPPEKS
jgi:hypothetical protein